MHTHAHAQCLMYGKGRYSLFFEVTNFVVWCRSVETAKINTLESFPLYGMIEQICNKMKQKNITNLRGKVSSHT